ncbi:hypothetical protein DSLPV1_118 [Dishui lake phycodnavirus 1]|uniref:hypothetical protein n=1 Tax=Dishui lake phycodnavirus 1 TaxID=2079134 RepID=UPI000CD6938E|nr:hypothetical protein C5Y57_gp118 [Dishui lake phycodnavirus 1]AUT19089.1 hypothetical protein DSLPV1_118 [Dishui lake phycodnavirus 1]
MSFIGAEERLCVHEYKGRKMVLSDGDKPMRFQMPRLYMPWGVSAFTPEIGEKKYNVDFNLTGWDEDGGFVQKFYNTIKSIESKVIDEVSKQSVAIFGEPKGVEELRGMFNSNLKEAENGHAPKFRVKLDVDSNGLAKPEIFDTNRNLLKDEIKEGVYCRMSGKGIAEVGSVYFLNKRFGITYKLYQMQVFEPERLKGFSFSV